MIGPALSLWGKHYHTTTRIPALSTQSVPDVSFLSIFWSGTWLCWKKCGDLVVWCPAVISSSRFMSQSPWPISLSFTKRYRPDWDVRNLSRLDTISFPNHNCLARSLIISVVLSFHSFTCLTDANNEGSARQDNVWKGNRASETSDSLTLITSLDSRDLETDNRFASGLDWIVKLSVSKSHSGYLPGKFIHRQRKVGISFGCESCL